MQGFLNYWWQKWGKCEVPEEPDPGLFERVLPVPSQAKCWQHWFPAPFPPLYLPVASTRHRGRKDRSYYLVLPGAQIAETGEDLRQLCPHTWPVLPSLSEHPLTIWQQTTGRSVTIHTCTTWGFYSHSGTVIMPSAFQVKFLNPQVACCVHSAVSLKEHAMLTGIAQHLSLLQSPY